MSCHRNPGAPQSVPVSLGLAADQEHGDGGFKQYSLALLLLPSERAASPPNLCTVLKEPGLTVHRPRRSVLFLSPQQPTTSAASPITKRHGPGNR
ncbi:hypothetical protein SKAU_G00127800 [Synaphobranchus kaupii]|uniref:Uncharacterized protein n=1 Tax=Synaphobranchus kaupii TaxID=118154 RepID=A0A9Q1J226_SYNKA|nr:hypothetical protein SKAU_G00127800 [Synaphobranchus kaupii]